MTYPDVPNLAMQVFGADLKIIYIIRNPLDRAISHHRYLYTRYKDRDVDFNNDYRRGEYLDYGLYGKQIKLWSNVFGSEGIRVVTFDRYLRERQSCYDDLCEFLNIPSIELTVNTVSNVTADLATLPPFIQRRTEGALYKNIIRPMLVREGAENKSYLGWLRKRLRKSQNIQFPAVSEAVARELWKEFEPDIATLGQWLDAEDLEYVKGWSCDSASSIA
ncbi:sulfotransferase domain-containing protein [Rubritalea tangerina]